MPKLREIRCEVCGEKVDELGKYADILKEQLFNPQDYLKHQLEMSAEEKEARVAFFTEMFKEHNEQRNGG